MSQYRDDLASNFPVDWNSFAIELYETGNAPDYSYVYAQGVQAGRGASEGYTLKNCPKYQPDCKIEVTGNPGSDMFKYNYCKIDYSGTGDGVKWYFITNKVLLNYPKTNTSTNWFTIEYTLVLDVWETYKDKLDGCNIKLEQVTTSDPGGWSDVSMLEQDILPYSGVNTIVTERKYSNYKTVVGWQAKKPSAQDNFIIDGMQTTLQFTDNGDLSDYLDGLDDLATGTPEETNIWKTYVACNTYVVPDEMSTENGGTSQLEVLSINCPSTVQTHARLNYYPYRRAFIWTIDGQQVELDYKKYLNNKLPSVITCRVNHSILPQPTSVIQTTYDNSINQDIVIFSGYPTMDMVGKNITPISQVTEFMSKAWAVSSGHESTVYTGG